jgi:phosphopantothenoylcysteine decarboxylase / phosphopantothenate---cysteine ligase
MISGKKIILAITGSIAAYKAIVLLRLLTKAGADVQVVMTPSAADFVSPLTLSTLSAKPVHMDLFKDGSWSNHVMLGRSADLLLVAPASCNTIAKMAHGICDNLVLATYLSATCPVMLAPAMDEDMWHHPATKANIDTLQAYGHALIPVEHGSLASGLVGEGRMAEPETMLHFIEAFFSSQLSLSGKRVLVTAGPTYEPLDPVRFIGNHSSGKMGLAITQEFVKRGASVSLVLGPDVQASGLPSTVQVIRVTTADQMYQACMDQFSQVDIAVMAAAVADYTPVVVADEKIKKTGSELSIELRKTKDILKAMGQVKKTNQYLVGFALETTNEEVYAKGKLVAKNADMIVLNSLNDSAAGFGKDTNKVTIFDRAGGVYPYSAKSKSDVAKDIIDLIQQKLDA